MNIITQELRRKSIAVTMAHEPLLKQITRMQGDLERSARAVARWGQTPDQSAPAIDTAKHCYNCHGLLAETSGGERCRERSDQVIQMSEN